MEFKNELFPNTETIAYYDSFGQYINLSKYDERDSLEKLKNEIKDDYSVELVCTLNHELQHWLDHVSTIWGLDSLINIYNALNCKLINNEKNFWRINSLMKEYKRSSFSEYYHVTFNRPKFKSLADRWRWEISIGFKFNSEGYIDEDKPILFIRFNDKTNKPVSRTPISIHSFLETNAMFNELQIKAGYIESKKDDIVEYKLQENKFLARNLSWLYNPDLTVYSVVSHAVSNILGISDIAETMRIASILSTFILNIPNDYYKKVPVNKHFDYFGERCSALVSQTDKGFIFLNLLYNYRDKYLETKEFNPEHLLECSKLPAIEQVEKTVLSNAKSLEKQIIDGPFREKISELLQKGIILLEKRGVFNQNKIDMTYLVTNNFFPQIIWGDSYYDLDTLDEKTIMYKIHNQQALDFWEWYKFEEHMFTQFNIFSNICGI